MAAYVSLQPLLIDAFVSLAKANLTLSTYDGTGVSEDPGDYLQAGVEDPETDSWQPAATSTQEWAYAGHTAVTEEGTVSFTLKSWNGDGSDAGMKAARDTAFANLKILSDLIRTDPTVGLGPMVWSTRLGGINLEQIQDQNGSAARLRFQIAFSGQF